MTDLSIPASGTSTNNIVNASANSIFSESTITRVVGTIDLRATDAGPVIAVEYSLGIITVGERAVSIGASALSDPTDPEGHDWMYWRSGLLIPMALPTDSSSLAYHEKIEVDIRSQRRLRENASDLVLIVGNFTSEVAMGLTVGLNALVKLP